MVGKRKRTDTYDPAFTNIYPMTNVPVFRMSRYSSLIDGIINCTSVAEYTADVVQIDYSLLERSGITVHTNMINRWPTGEDVFFGTGIHLFSTGESPNGQGWGLDFNCNITRFDYGYKLEKPIAGSVDGVNGWYNIIDIDGIVLDCLTAIHQTTGGSTTIKGNIQPFTSGTAGRERTLDRPLIYLGAGQTKCDAFVWAVEQALNKNILVNNSIGSQLGRSLSLLLETKRGNIEVGKTGLISSDFVTIKPQVYGNPVGIGPNASKHKMFGIQDNILMGAHKKFTTMHIYDSTKITVENNAYRSLNAPFKAERELLEFNLNVDVLTEETFVTEITFPLRLPLHYIGAVFNGIPYKVKIEALVRDPITLVSNYITLKEGYGTDLFYAQNGNDNMVVSWDYRIQDDSLIIGDYDDFSMSSLRFTFTVTNNTYLYGTTKGSNITIASLFAYDGSQQETFLPSYGGVLRGDINFINTATGVILNDRSTGAKYRLKVTDGVLGVEDISTLSTLIASDTFNRLDSTTTLTNTETWQPWIPLLGTWGIASNNAYTPTSLNNSIAVFDCLNGNIDLTCAVSNSAWTSVYGGVVLRATDVNNLLIFVSNNAGNMLYKKDGGVYTQLATNALIPVNNTEYINRVVANGNVITCYIDGVQKLTYTLVGDEVAKFGIAKTKFGMHSSSSAFRFNNLKCNSL